jgi:HIRAN domain-containing protein
VVSPIAHVPVVAGPAYIERVRQLPPQFTARLAAEPDNRFNRFAVAVLTGGDKIGYLPPEISHHYFDAVRSGGSPVECPARSAPESEFENTGVMVLLDFTRLSNDSA